jgi:predicted SAM-dependent methyltransferase
VGEIRRYLDERQAAKTRGLERGPAARLLRRLTPFEARQAAKVQATKLLAPVERRRARRLAAGPLRLHLGSGGHELPGWVNVDLVGMGSDLRWDLTSRLPFDDGSADAVFLEHVLEHFPLETVLAMLAESRRVLAPGGILRAGVPDFGRYAESYAGDRAFLEERRPGRPTPLLALAEVALSHGHRSVWDGETLELVLTESGLVEVRRRVFGDTDLPESPDNPSREAESVYAEGRAA